MDPAIRFQRSPRLRTWLATDTNGNIYITGTTGGELDGNTNAGHADLFLVKYDNTGSRQWARQHGTHTTDEAYGVATDASGNVYVAGWTSGGLDGNPTQVVGICFSLSTTETATGNGLASLAPAQWIAHLSRNRCKWQHLCHRRHFWWVRWKRQCRWFRPVPCQV